MREEKYGRGGFVLKGDSASRIDFLTQSGDRPDV